MGKSNIVATFSLLQLLLLLFLQTLTHVHAGYICYGDFFTVNYRINRDILFTSLPSDVISNGGFYNGSLGKDSENNRVHVVALCGRGYENEACKKCLEHVIENTKSYCPRNKESFSWVTYQLNDCFCNLRYTNYSTFGKLDLSPFTLNPHPNDINSPIPKNMTLLSQEWISMVNRTLEAASTPDTFSVLKYYNATRTEFTEISDVYALMQCTPDISPSDCKRCLRECVAEFRKQAWGRQGGGVGRPSCYFRWDLFPFYKAFDNVTRVLAPPRPPQPSSTTLDCGKDKRSLGGRNIAIIVVPVIINFFVFVGLMCSWKRKSPHTPVKALDDSDDCKSMLRFDLGMILTATHDFSLENKLGEGGFGSVYKGILPSGQTIAVKRLSRGSGQGDTEFRNEVLLLTRLQHRNLVKFHGFCNEGDEQILVYEFVPNSSLDSFIFDEDKRLQLTWDVRCRIIEGIARGLLYLHEDSQLRIIHRDLKASNILLDAEMTPKLADFGMARLFNMDQSREVASRVAGTYGYMAPEYIRNRELSVKTDVYSFGVVLLEMITGKSNNNYVEEAFGLPAFAWKCWVAGQAVNIIDPVLSRNQRDEIIRFIHIGLLCVQDNVAKRPIMSLVIQWLGSETIMIPAPTHAAFATHLQRKDEVAAFSLNDLSFTILSPR